MSKYSTHSFQTRPFFNFLWNIILKNINKNKKIVLKISHSLYLLWLLSFMLEVQQRIIVLYQDRKIVNISEFLQRIFKTKSVKVWKKQNNQIAQYFYFILKEKQLHLKCPWKSPSSKDDKFCIKWVNPP